DNQIATLSTWDQDLLTQEIIQLQEWNVDLDVLGFSAEDLLRYCDPPNAQGATDPDDIPDPPERPETRPGDLILLGKHRLLCGDSSKAADVDRLLEEAPIHLVNSDPPYNVRVEPRSKNAIAAGHSSFTLGPTKKGVPLAVQPPKTTKEEKT